MIEQILRFAAGQSRRPTYELGPVAMPDAVARVLANVTVLPEAEGFTVEREIDPDLPPVQADAAALTHCLENLILNALKYGGDTRWVRVRATPDGSRVRIHVEDRGQGIDPADLPHIFEPFYRGKAAQAAQIHGAGLGLSLARDIAEAMGGRLDASSEPGQGSTFTLELAPPEFPPRKLGRACAYAGLNMERRILLIEDEPGLVMTLGDRLRGEGYEVESAADGQTGLRHGLRRRLRPDHSGPDAAAQERHGCLPRSAAAEASPRRS